MDIKKFGMLSRRDLDGFIKSHDIDPDELSSATENAKRQYSHVEFFIDLIVFCLSSFLLFCLFKLIFYFFSDANFIGTSLGIACVVLINFRNTRNNYLVMKCFDFNDDQIDTVGSEKRKLET